MSQLPGGISESQLGGLNTSSSSKKQYEPDVPFSDIFQNVESMIEEELNPSKKAKKSTSLGEAFSATQATPRRLNCACSAAA